MVNRLNGLRHNAVVCRNNQNDNIGNLCTTSTHSGKGLVTWGIDEGNLTAVNSDLRSTDCLCNAAGLTSCNTGVTDCVQKRCLTVVNVTHDGNYWRTWLQVLRIIVEGEGILLFLGHNLNLATKVISNNLNKLIRHGLGERQRVAKQEQALNDVICRNAKKLSKFRDSRALRNLYGIKLGNILVVCECFLNTLLHSSLCSLLLTTLFTLFTATSGLTACLFNSNASFIQNAASVVSLSLTRHTAITVFSVISAATILLALTVWTLIRHGSVIALILEVMTRRSATCLACIGASVISWSLLSLLLSSGLRCLLLQYLFLLSNLVKQVVEGRSSLRSGILYPVTLGLFSLKTLLLLLSAAALLFFLASSLLFCALLLFFSTLSLTPCLCSKSLSLCCLCGCLCLFGSSLFLSSLLSCDFSGTSLHNRLEFLTNNRDICIFKRRRSGLCRNLHVRKVLEQFLALHTIFFGKVMYTHFCHI